MKIAPFQPDYSKILFNEEFLDIKSVADNGAEITGTPTINNGIETDGVGSNYLTYYNLQDDAVWRTKGTIIFKARIDTDLNDRVFGTQHAGGSTYQWRTFFTSSNFLMVVPNGSTFATVEFSNGNYTLGETRVFAITWNFNGTNTTLKGYMDGVLASTSPKTLAGFPIAPNGSGFNINSWTSGSLAGKTDWFRIYAGELSQEEIQDIIDNKTFEEVDPRQSLIWLPLKGRYNDGTEKTENIGQLGDATVGDGSTTASYPDFIVPNGVSSTVNNKYIQNTIPQALGKDFTIGVIAEPTNLAASSKLLLEIGDYTTDGIMVNQFNGILYFYWNFAGPSITLTNIFTTKKTSVIVSSKGGLVTIYIDGENKGTTDLSAKTGLSAGLLWYLFQEGSSNFKGRAHTPFVYDFGVTELQAEYLNWKMFNELNL